MSGNSINAILNETQTQPRLGKKYLYRRYAILVFLTEEGSATNNRAERARENVVIRKTIGTLRNEKGTYIHETIILLPTLKLRGFNLDEMLKTHSALSWFQSLFSWNLFCNL